VKIRRFLCCLYQLSRNRYDVHENGMVPRDIYNLLELSPEGEELVNQKVKWLVDRCLEKGYIQPGDDGRIKITDDGNKRCEITDEYGHSYCSGLPSYSGKAKAIILTPFTTTGQSVAAQISEVLNDLKVTPIFFAQMVKVSPFTEIDKADIVIADLSEANPNVMFEVGYAQGRGKPVLYIMQSDETIPSDLMGNLVYLYDKDSPNRLRGSISGAIKMFVGETGYKNESK